MTGNDVKNARKELGLSQQQLADKWGVTRLTIITWEARGEQLLPNPKIGKILISDLLKK